MRESVNASIANVVKVSLRGLAADPHVRSWRAKERNWVSYFAHRHLIPCFQEAGPLSHPSQIGIEVAVPQPAGYVKPTVSRDLVVWAEPGATCWSDDWEPCNHPLAILEWKVHRPGHRNAKVNSGRAWLRAYCAWQPAVLGYAIEVDGCGPIATLRCARFSGTTETPAWLQLELTQELG
jgi:hypothetical protein